MQIYLYNSDDFDSLGAAIKERRIISAMAVFFEVRRRPARRVETGRTPSRDALTLMCPYAAATSVRASATPPVSN